MQVPIIGVTEKANAQGLIDQEQIFHGMAFFVAIARGLFSRILGALDTRLPTWRDAVMAKRGALSLGRTPPRTLRQMRDRVVPSDSVGCD
jgi:hypothetical protein